MSMIVRVLQRGVPLGLGEVSWPVFLRGFYSSWPPVPPSRSQQLLLTLESASQVEPLAAENRLDLVFQRQPAASIGTHGFD